METSFDKSQDLRVIKTKTAIIHAFWELLYEKNIDEISIKSICDKAQVNRSTFYLHFEDKQQLLVQSIYDAMFKINQDAVAKCTTSDLYEYYTILGDITFAILTKNKQKYRKLFAHNDINMFFEPAQSFLSFNIHRHIKLIKSKNKKFDLPSSLISEFYSGGITSIAKWWVSTDKNVSPEKFHQLITTLLTNFLKLSDYHS